MSQLTHQDPLNPLKDTEFIAQLAQFTSLEQMKAIQGDISQMRSQQHMIQAMSLVGKEAVVHSHNDGIVAGVIQGIEMNGNKAQLIIGDERYDLDDIITIGMANQIS